MTVINPPKPVRYKGQRIIAGALHNVITENGKIVKDLGVANRDQKKQPNVIKMSNVEEEKPNVEEEKPNVEEEKPKVAEEKPKVGEERPKVEEEKPKVEEEKPNVEEEKPKVGLLLISEDGSYIDPSRKAEETNDNTIIKPSSVSQKQKPKFGKKPEWEDILSKIPEPDPDRQNSQESNNIPQEQKPKSGIRMTPVSMEELGNILKQNKQEKHAPAEKVPIAEPPNVPEPTKVQEEPKKSHIPTIEPVKKPQQVPKITIPKVQINIPPKNEPIKLENISNKLGDILTTDTYPKPRELEVVEQSLQKANENILPQHPVTTEDKPTKEKRISMPEELEAELLDERKFEQWMKKQKFQENLAKMAKFAEETSQQKIPELSGKIEDVHGQVENIHGEVKNVDSRLDTFSSNVDNRLGTVDKTIGNLCTGIDCVKEDAKKYITSQEALEKLVQERFQELGEKIQSLDRPTFTCENCGAQVIAPLSSYCPNCGSEIQSWSDEEGQPVKGWAPYWKRSGRSASQ
jgi:hypothetical protein